jgi:chromatin remodeling complex protein RSC6
MSTTTNNNELFTDIDNQFKEIYSSLNVFMKQSKVISDQLKTLQRNCKQADRAARIRNKRPQEPMNVSKELAKFLKIGNGEQLTKASVMKMVSTYIKEKNLQIADDKRKFVPNKELVKIFGITKPQNMTFVEINKHVSQHLSKESH